MSTATIESTGGIPTRCAAMRGATKFPSIRWMSTPSAITSSARVPPLGSASTNAAGRTTEMPWASANTSELPSTATHAP